MYPEKGKKKGLLSTSHFSELCLWSPSTAMNLVSLQREEELSPKSLSAESHYVPCPLFSIKTHVFTLHTVESQSFTPALTYSSHLFIARQTKCKSRYLETFISSNICFS